MANLSFTLFINSLDLKIQVSRSQSLKIYLFSFILLYHAKLLILNKWELSGQRSPALQLSSETEYFFHNVIV